MFSSQTRAIRMGLPVIIAGAAIAFAAPLAMAADTAKPAAAPAPGVLATVGDVTITESDLTASMPADRQKAFQNADQRLQDIERQAIMEMFAKRYVDDQIKAKGITEDAFYAQEIAANRDKFDADYKTQITQVKGQVYEAKRATLEDYIGKKLEEKAAKDKGVTVDALVKTEVEDKVAPVTPADIDQYYTQNQRNFGGQTKDAVSKQIEDAIKAQRVAAKRVEYRNALRTTTPVRVYMPVPRIEVATAGEPIKGSPTAPVVIVHFSDFQCPFCSRVMPTFDRIEKDYGDKVAIVWRDFPLSFHQYAQKAAEASACANKQGKFWPYHDKLFANQSALAIADLKKLAEGMSLDMAAFNQCLDSGEMKSEIDKDVKEGGTYGVQGTPASFINGRFLSGAQPYEAFKKVIDDELQLKGIPVPTAQAAATPTSTAKN